MTHYVTLFLSALVFVASFAGETAHGADSPSERYNVLFIISDDLTANALSCYGNTVSKTPSIDRLPMRAFALPGLFARRPIAGHRGPRS